MAFANAERKHTHGGVSMAHMTSKYLPTSVYLYILCIQCMVYITCSKGL